MPRRRNARRPARLAAAALLAAATLLPRPGSAEAPLRDAPVVWFDDDSRDVPMPAPRDVNLQWDQIDEGFVRPLDRMFDPVRFVRLAGSPFGADHVPAAADINALDEVPNSSWFTNRIGLFPMTPEEAARGAGSGEGPDPSAPWTIISAKTEGVTPGFNIRDARGGVFLIKFDAPGFSGMSSGAGAICVRIFHAIGFNVPDDNVVAFRREDLVLGDKVSIKFPDGTKRPMTVEDIDRILARVPQTPDGTWRAISSRFLEGKPLGPFETRGRRKDDPNDRIEHENRRVLRGYRMFSSWLAHFDTKQSNSLDMYVEEDGRHFVRHHLIDFASTLGSGASGPRAIFAHEGSFEYSRILERSLALGFSEDDWRTLGRPEGLDEVGYFETDYDPLGYSPLQSHWGFCNMTDRDGYWAAKIISAFTDDHLAAIVETAHYRDPRAADYLTRALATRRDRIARDFFDRVPPLDFFTHDAGTVRFHDLGAERGIYPGSTPRYRARVRAVDAGRDGGSWSPWRESANPEVLLGEPGAQAAVANDSGTRYPFIAVECGVDRGSGWSPATTAYVARASGRVVAIDR